jgi:hypothetical protein
MSHVLVLLVAIDVVVVIVLGGGGGGVLLLSFLSKGQGLQVKSSSRLHL